MYTIKCNQCGTEFTGKDEYEAEVKWSALHKCTVDYDSMSLEDLTELLRLREFRA